MRTSPRLRSRLAAAAAALLLPLAGTAAPIAAWNFDLGNAEDVSGVAPDYDLASIGGGPDMSSGFARFSGSEASPAYLELDGFGGNPQWTVSLWVRSQGQLDQGQYQGIFSNNDASGAAYSWQVESFDGDYQWRNQAGTFLIGTPIALDEWDHIVIRKFGGNDGDVWFNGVQVVSALGANPGGLQRFRLGTNRNTNNFFQGDVDDVRVFDSVEDPVTLFNSGLLSIPEPGTGLLVGAGLFALGLARRRQRSAR